MFLIINNNNNNNNNNNYYYYYNSLVQGTMRPVVVIKLLSYVVKFQSIVEGFKLHAVVISIRFLFFGVNAESV